MPDPQPRVLIADDHDTFRPALRAALADAGACVVAEATTGIEAVRLALEAKPDVVILDVRMPELDGLAAAARILSAMPAMPIVMLSLSRSKQHVLRALVTGARAYVAKDDAVCCLAEAIRVASTRGYFLSESIVAALEKSEAAAFSAEAQRDTLALYDQEVRPMFRCAWAAADSEEHAREALRRSFLAYLVARNSTAKFQNPRAWLLVSIAAFLFDQRGSSAAGGAGRKSRGSLQDLAYRLWTGWREHPSHGLFQSYWSGSAPAFIRARLLDHVSECASCHFEWSLIAFTKQYGETRLETANPGEVQRLRAELLHDIENMAVIPSILALAERDAKVRELMASDIEVLLGTGAMREWKQRTGSGLTHGRSPVTWTTDFLGQGAAPFVETLLQSSEPSS